MVGIDDALFMSGMTGVKLPAMPALPSNTSSAKSGDASGVQGSAFTQGGWNVNFSGTQSAGAGMSQNTWLIIAAAALIGLKLWKKQ